MNNKKRSFAILGAVIVVLLIAGGLFYFIPRLKSGKPTQVQDIEEKEDGLDSTEETENMIKLAQYYIDKEEFDLARNQLEQVLIKDPENELARSLLEDVVRQKKEQEMKDERREDEKLDRVVSSLKDSIPEQKLGFYLC